MYTLRDADEGLCPDCSKELKLLTHKGLPDGYPAFLICFACRSVVEVDGDDGEVVEYKGGRRKKHTAANKHRSPLNAKQIRLRQYRAGQGD